MNNSLHARVDSHERRLRWLEQEIDELKALAALAETPAPVSAPPPPAPIPRPAPKPVRQEELDPEPLWEPAPEPRPREPIFRVDLAIFTDARALAWAGGVVTLLGILFFFALAVNRGWIGPGARVLLGAAASLLVFSAGVWLRRRFGETHSAFAAVGAGIAGGYGTLLAAAALYGLLPDYAALAVAAGIALVGVCTSLVWRSELVAGLGLVGAALVPVVVLLQGGLTTLGTTFAVIVFAGTCAVAMRQQWRTLLVAGVVATLPQVCVLVGGQEGTPRRVVALVAFAALAYAAAGVAWHLVAEQGRLRGLSIELVSLAAALEVTSSLALFHSDADRGFAVLAAAAAFAAAAAAFFTRRRDLSAFLGAICLTAGAIAGAELLSGQPLAYAWAAEAAALAWLAARVRDLRYQALGFGYLGLAVAHVLSFDAPPMQLVEAGGQPGAGALAAAATAAAAACLGRRSAGWRQAYEGVLAQVLEPFRKSLQQLGAGSFWVAGVVAAYAAALGLLQLFVSAGAGFGWGHVAVDGVWAAIGLGLLLAGLGRDSRPLVGGAFAWLGATGTFAAVYDSLRVEVTPRSVAFLVLAGAALAAAAAYELRRKSEFVAGIGGVPIVSALALGLAAIVELTPAGDIRGAAVLGLAAVYGALAAMLWRRRDRREPRTMLWAIALGLAAAAAPLLVGGTYLVLAWTAASAVVIAGLRRLGEARLEVASLGYLVLALGHALVFEGPPTDLFTAQAHPATGVPALLGVVAAAAVFACRTKRGHASWGMGAVAVYTASLTVLELVQRVSPAGVEADFQRGQSQLARSGV